MLAQKMTLAAKRGVQAFGYELAKKIYICNALLVLFLFASIFLPYNFCY